MKALSQMHFNYSAIDGGGFTQNGNLDAPDESEAVRQLSARGLTPMSLEARIVSQIPSATSGASRKVRQSDIFGLIRELATLMSSGIGVAEALATLQEAITHPGLRQALASITSSVHDGEGFSSALRTSGLPFPEYVHALARAGEATGDIGGALSRAADQLEFDERMRNEAKEALTYPAILILTGVGAIIFVFSFVVPRFAGLLKGRSVDLPFLSEAVLKTGVFVNLHWVEIAVTIVVLGFLMAGIQKTPRLNATVVTVLSKLPVFSTWFDGAETARWTSILAVLVNSRVPILLSIELAATSVRLAENTARLRSVENEVRQGKSLSAAIEERQMLEGSALSMLKVGEKSGELGSMLGYVSAYTAERHRVLQRRLVSLIEPVSILVIGVVLGIIMVGVVLAMTSLTEVKL